jgi:hypothetical protein
MSLGSPKWGVILNTHLPPPHLAMNGNPQFCHGRAAGKNSEKIIGL